METKEGNINPAFTSEENPPPSINNIPDAQRNGKVDSKEPQSTDVEAGGEVRATWGKDIEFLLSCIALSVGLGNVWRFPFVALENGGGAFLIPYIIVLFLVGKPIYYMEMLLGQFSSRGSVKVYDFSPVMRGVGYGQVFSTAVVGTYYATLMALTIRYFVASFSAVLPWSYCREEWGLSCLDTNKPLEGTSGVNQSTPAELYFVNIILKEKVSIADGIGNPSWQLVICLAFSWIVVIGILVKGIRSSGKASYFLAIFPYAVMIILLIRSATLPGAGDGVLLFITPQWDKLLEPKVWYAAVTQVFFSLAICFGNIVMYSSYNRFNQNIYKDAMIVTTLDTFTSLLSGVIIFGILGNLAYETGVSDITSVVQGGAGLAFISYPDAIAKFKFVPQVFAVLFFTMLYVLGIGSNVGMASCVMTVITDRFTNLKPWLVGMVIGCVGFGIGIMYLTPGGQHLLNLVDFFGVSFVILCLGIVQLVAIGWVYGVKRVCKDIEFMMGRKTGLYWRICWGFVTPFIMGVILIYFIATFEPLVYKNEPYPRSATIAGWCLWAVGVSQFPLWAIYAIWKQPRAKTCWQRFCNAFKPQENWGPIDPTLLEEYRKYIAKEMPDVSHKNFFSRFYDNIFG